MYPLVQQCVAGKTEAWADLWLIYEHFAAHPVRRLLERAGVDPTEAHDVAQEIFVRLYENKCKRLRSFRGNSEAELKNWLVHLAINCTRNWIKNRWGTQRRQRKALKGVQEPTRDAPSEAEVQSLIEDLEAVLSRDDVNRLRRLAGLEVPPGQEFSGQSPVAPSKRTERRKRKELEQKVRGHLGLGSPRKRKRAKPDEASGEENEKN